MKSLWMVLLLGCLVGCQSSTTNSYVFIGDEAIKRAPKVEEMKMGAFRQKDVEQPPVGVDSKTALDLGGQATNGTCIIIGVNSSTSKPVDVETGNGNDVAVGKATPLEKVVRTAGAAGGAAVGGPGGAAVGSVLPEAVGLLKDAAKEAAGVVGQ